MSSHQQADTHSVTRSKTHVKWKSVAYLEHTSHGGVWIIRLVVAEYELPIPAKTQRSISCHQRSGVQTPLWRYDDEIQDGDQIVRVQLPQTVDVELKMKYPSTSSTSTVQKRTLNSTQRQLETEMDRQSGAAAARMSARVSVPDCASRLQQTIGASSLDEVKEGREPTHHTPGDWLLHGFPGSRVSWGPSWLSVCVSIYLPDGKVLLCSCKRRATSAVVSICLARGGCLCFRHWPMTRHHNVGKYLRGSRSPLSGNESITMSTFLDYSISVFMEIAYLLS